MHKISAPLRSTSILISPRASLVEEFVERLISSIISVPRTRATADWFRLFLAALIRLTIVSRWVSAGYVVPRRVARLCDGLADASRVNSARSWASVSLIKAVMSGVLSKALVKILGGGKLRGEVGSQDAVFIYYEF